ncbi:leucine-rich repeat-containing protein 49-like isoform X2 [Haliotis rufescens]|uniref:leucine-rich repeat-containing protein 49-like isoform X2 n=1 Tax=Haliotis rufescens TaxID=6454 RepID=UPI00201F4B82|nr:leucine-rich repeat-containing protein 49-like isoform X2 [Haliotis rufescens]
MNRKTQVISSTLSLQVLPTSTSFTREPRLQHIAGPVGHTDPTTVVFRQTHSNDIAMRRYNQTADFTLNNFAENQRNDANSLAKMKQKIPIHYRGGKRPIVPAAACAHDLSRPDVVSPDDDESVGSHPHSAQFAPKAQKAAAFLPGDRVIFAESPSAPGIPVVYRAPEERASNPDRLNLDRRKLTVCPILEGEEQLRLLNYQHNFITKIQHLSSLKRLIFLDLYDNQIEEINGLGALKSLRVLMLGKNKIKKIENLDNLVKLDVLDLHGNQIKLIENLTHLAELRVLNLAGNQIRHVDNLMGMDALAELNLRRNRILTIVDVDTLPNLQRLFLSFNDICSFEDISCLGESTSLSEISLDGNPIAQDQYYKQVVLRHMQQIKQLDMKRVSEEERRIALVMARKEEEKKRENNKISVMKEKRRIAINNAKRQWETMQGSLLSRTGRLVSGQRELYANHIGTINNSDFMSHSPDGDDNDSITSDKRMTSRPGSARSNMTMEFSGDGPRERPRTSSRRGDKTQAVHKETMLFGKSNTNNGKELSNLADLEGDTLTLYGPQSLEALDKNWGIQAAGTVTSMVFKFVDFEEITKHLHKVRTRFPSVQTLVFSSTNINSLQQINALSNIRRIDNLTIDLDGNPVTKFTLWRMYTIFRLAHFSLKKINDVEVSPTDIVNAEKLFGPLSFIIGYKTPQLRSELRKKGSMSYEDKPRKSGDSKQAQIELEGRSRLVYLAPGEVTTANKDSSKTQFARSYINELTKEAIFADKKRAELQRLWPQMFYEMVQSTLSDMQDMKTYMKKCTEELDKS